MNNPMYSVSPASRVATVVVNRTLRNTYALLGMLFVFAAGTAFVAQSLGLRIGFWPFLIGIFAFSFAIAKTRNSAWGLVWAFGFAGLLGLVTGGNVNAVMAQYSNGGTLVVSSFGLTAGIFFGLSAYAMNTKRDFSGWFAFLAVGTIAVIGAFVLNWFLQIPALALALSTMIILIACGWIIWQTQQIVRNGETNYIMAATNLLADIFVLFNNLLALLGFGFGED
jgi:modulator of FtsH protease